MRFHADLSSEDHWTCPLCLIRSGPRTCNDSLHVSNRGVIRGCHNIAKTIYKYRNTTTKLNRQISQYQVKWQYDGTATFMN